MTPTTGLAPGEPIRVTATPHPFSVRRVHLAAPQGLTVDELVRGAGVPDFCEARVFIERGGLVYGPVPRRLWSRMRPRADSHVTIKAVPYGGGDGQDDNKTLRLVLQVVIILIAIVIIAVSWGSLTYVGLVLIVLAVGLGFVLVNALLPPPMPKLGSLANLDRPGLTDSDTFAVTGSRNRANPYGPIPVIYGQHRIFPPFGAVPFTEILGNDQYLRQLFVVGYGPLDLTELKIGETPIDNFEGVEYEVRTGAATDEPLTLYTDDVDEDPLSIALTAAGGPQARTGGQPADELSVDIVFPQGLVAIGGDGSQGAFTVQVTIEYRKAGDVDWIEPPGSPLVVTDNRVSQVRRGLRWAVRQWARPVADVDAGTWGTAPLFAKLDEAVASDADLITSVSDPAGAACEVQLGAVPDPAQPGGHVLRYRIGKDVAGGKTIAVTVALYQGAELIADWAHADVGVLATFAQTLTVAQAAAITDYADLRLRFTATVGAGAGSRAAQVSWCEFELPSPAETFEVRLTRDTADNADLLIHDDVVWSSLRTIRKTVPITLPGLALVALRIKATDQLNGVVDSFNCLAQAVLPDWDAGTETWITRPTASPAAAYRAALQGKGNARPVADERINLASLQQWAVDASAAGMTFNQVVDFRHTVFEQLRDTASAARAAFTMIDGKFGVVQDKAQATPVQHFTPRNSFNFHGRKAFLDFPHALKVRFINPAADWQQDEMVVYDDGFDATTATRLEVLETIGITDPDQAWRLGRYHLAVMRLRPEIYEFSADFENLICTRGDLIRLSHDVLLVGLAVGRILSVQTDGGTCLGVTLDEACPMASGTEYGVRIRYADGTSVVKAVITEVGAPKAVTFGVPFAAPHPAVGDLVLFGEAGLESLEVIVKEIQHDKDLIARITALPYHPAIYAADQGAIPPFTTGITLPPSVNRDTPLPIIAAASSDESVLVRDPDGSLQAQILLTVRYGAAALAVAEWVEVQFRRSDSTSAYVSLPNQPPLVSEISVRPVEQGVAYDVRLRTANAQGVTSAWALLTQHLVIGKTSKPPSPTGVLLLDGILSWDYTPPRDFHGFILRRIPGAVASWDQGLKLHDGVHPASSFATLPSMYGAWTLMVKGQDTSGNRSEGVGALTVDFGAPPVQNAVLTQDEHAGGFTGTITDGSVNGVSGDLEADQELTNFWTVNTAQFWTDNANLFWVGPYKQLVYEFELDSGADGGGTSLLIDLQAQGNWHIDYKLAADSTWLPFPGVVPGIVASTTYDIRVTIDAGPTQGIISVLTAYLDAPDLVETFDDFAVAVTTGTRLPIAATYRAIKRVSLTVQASGAETAITARAEDKDETNGPLVMAYDAGGVVVAGHVDAVVTGY